MGEATSFPEGFATSFLLISMSAFARVSRVPLLINSSVLKARINKPIARTFATSLRTMSSIPVPTDFVRGRSDPERGSLQAPG